MFAFAACTTPAFKAPDVPPALRPPADQVLLLEAAATGVQIYSCALSPTQPGQFEWVFKAPEATLMDASGKVLGKHFSGPSWEAEDGSMVVGAVQARDPGPDPHAIPWLLLNAKTTSASGLFSKVTSIQRLKTKGGNPPSTSCGPEQAGQVLRVPYTASYYFYSARL